MPSEKVRLGSLVEVEVPVVVEDFLVRVYVAESHCRSHWDDDWKVLVMALLIYAAFVLDAESGEPGDHMVKNKTRPPPAKRAIHDRVATRKLYGEQRVRSPKMAKAPLTLLETLAGHDSQPIEVVRDRQLR
jgi:hypothetical protein